MKRVLLSVLFAAAALMNNGCAALETRWESSSSARFANTYSGTKADICRAPMLLPIADLPFSFTLDTVILGCELVDAK